MANLSSYISTNTPASLNDLSDLSTSGASTGEVLSVNSDGTFSFIAIGGGTTSYNTIGDLPLVDNDTGDTAFVTANNKLYVWNGSGWYAIATVNETPTWDSGSSPESTYTVPNDGSSLTITLAASDPEGFPITYTAVTDSEFEAFAEITQNSDDSFTVTKLSSATQSATGTVTFRASDGVNILSNISTFTLTIISSVEDSKYTSLLLTSVGSNGGTNGSVTDGSTNSHSITVNGNASSQTYSPYRSGGYSYYFDGSNDYLQVASSDATNMGTGDFTIECWFYRTATAGNSFHDIILSNREDASFASGEWSIYVLPTTNGQFGFQSNNNSADKLEGGTCITGQWHHIAVVRSSGTMSLYVDGTSVSSKSNTSQIGTTSKILNFGAFGDGSYKCEGYVSDARLVSGTAVYTSNFTPPTERLEAVTNTSLLTCHLPYIKDGSTNDYSITSNGDVSAKPFVPYDYNEYDTTTHGGSIYFDGDGDWISLPSSSSFAFGTGDFTIDFWIYADSQSDKFILDTRNSSSGGGNLHITTGGYNGSLAGAVRVAGDAGDLVSTSVIDDEEWHHVAIVRSSGTTKIYIDGTSEVSQSDTTNYTNTNLIFSKNSYSSSGYITAYFSDIRIVKGTAVYTSNFTPPTQPVTAITNTSLLISSTDASIIDKSQSVNLTLVDSTQSSTSQTKYASSSIYFDGSDRIDLPNPSIPALSGDFTFEAWIYPTAVNYGAIFARGFGNNGGLLIWIQTNFNARFYRDDGAQLNLQSGSSISANQWTHIAVTRQGSSVKTFINGTVDQTGTMDPANYGLGNTSKFEIGAFNDSQQYFNGYMEDVRITKGLARYTSNFTPPTASLEA
jgi:hypothetical protein